MSKAVNAALIEGLTKELQDVDSCVVVGTGRMTVEQVSAFREALREQDFRMRVVKNSLAKLSFEKVKLSGLGEVLDGPSAVLWGGEGALAIAKVVYEAKKAAKDALVVHGGFDEGVVVDTASIEILSKIPGRKELLGMCLASFFGPASDMARNMDGLFTEVHGLLEAVIEEKGGA